MFTQPPLPLERPPTDADPARLTPVEETVFDEGVNNIAKVTLLKYKARSLSPEAEESVDVAACDRLGQGLLSLGRAWMLGEDVELLRAMVRQTGVQTKKQKALAKNLSLEEQRDALANLTPEALVDELMSYKRKLATAAKKKAKAALAADKAASAA